MRAASRWIAITAAGLAPWTAGCTDNSTGGGCDAGDAATGDGARGDSAADGARDAASDAPASSPADGTVTDVVPPDAALTGAMEAAATAPDADATTTSVAGVRVANWSPDAPSVDFCLAPHLQDGGTGAFQGPILARLVSPGAEAGTASDAPAALAFPQVSAYSYVSPGQYDARAVVAGAADCSAGVGQDGTMLPALGAGSFETIALVGEAHLIGSDPGLQLQLVGLLDTQTSSALALRFIHAAPGLSAMDFGTGTVGSGFQALFSGVQFGHASAAKEASPRPDGGAASVDSHGYLSMPPLSNAALSAHPHAGAAPDASTQDTVVASNVSAGAGTVFTIALVGATAAVGSIQLVRCVDNAGTVGLLGNCNVISQ